MRLLRDQLLLEQEVHARPRPPPVFVVGNKADCLPAPHPEHGSAHPEPPVALFRDLAALIRKQWKWAYAEVSALHAWHVQPLLQRVLLAVAQARVEGEPPPQPLLPPAPSSPHCRIL